MAAKVADEIGEGAFAVQGDIMVDEDVRRGLAAVGGCAGEIALTAPASYEIGTR